MDRITEITEATLNALAQIERMDGDSTAMPELLHQQLATCIEQGARSGNRLGLDHADVEDIRYALTALADEVVLARGGKLREFWLPRMLQLRFFNENIAGERFFDRLDAALRANRTDALKVFYLCLMFGFRGKYHVRGGELELADVTDRVGEALARSGAITHDVALSPHGPRPYEPIADGRRNSLLVWLSMTAAVAAVLLYIGLRLSLVNDADRLVERLIGIVGG